MARGSLGTISTVITMEKRLLVGLVVALVVGSASWAWADTINWPFTTAGNYTVSDATKVEVTDGVAKLIAVDQTDNDNTSTGFGGGTHNQTQWDGTNNWLELTATGQTNGSGDFISRVMDAGRTAAWDSISWAPQRPLYKELPDNKGIETAYPTGNADMTGNVLLMHMNEASGTIVDYSGEGNNGTQNGGVTYGASGKLNTALNFDGSNDYVNVPHSASLNITDAITVEAWMNPLADGWKYKRPITLSPATSVDNYQVNVILTTSNFDYSKAKANGEDIRFYDANGTSLNYWIENWNSSGTSTIWVKVATSGTDRIYMYYSNPSASSVSNGTNTFEFFDDFSGDLSKWTKHILPDSINIESGYLALTGGTTSSPYGFTAIGSDATYTSFTDGVIEAKYSAATDALPEFIFRGVYASNTGYKARYDCRDGSEQPWMKPPYSGWASFGTSITRCGIDDGTWNRIKVTVYGTSFEMFQNGSSKATVTDLSYAGPGEIGVANHYGSWIHVDDFRVRKYASPEPTATVGNETAAGISKAGAYGIGANTTTAFASINNQTISGAISSGWNHITLTYDKNAGGTDEMKLYVNGVQTATKDYSTAISTNTNNLWVGDLFNGTIDEVAIYNRALSATEIADHYKRGALRLKYQVRSGSTNPPTGDFIGPDSTTGTYYSELSNSTTGLPSLSLTNVDNNQYFQYKAYLETDNSSYSPELKSVVIGPEHYPDDNPTVQNNTGQTYVALGSFAETLGAGNEGSVKYQISDDGTNWYYWNASNWVAASGYSQTNTAAEVNTNCGQFDDDVGTGDFYFKAFLHSDAAAQQVELDQVDLGYTPIVISVWVSDSTFTFGTNPLNSWLTAQTSVITNDGNVAENFVGSISQFTDGANTWGISSSANGDDTTRAQWSTTSESGPWTDISAYDTDFTIATNVAVDDSVLFWFRIQTPISTSSYDEYSSTLTVTAQEY
jgi:hypothetical protein